MMIISETPSRKESAVLSRSFFVEEERVAYTKHDLMFKRLLETFFAEFMEAFFPDMYGEIDFESMTHLSEEMVPRLRDADTPTAKAVGF